MKAVNLIPAEARRGGAGPGRSGGAVYVLLGALAAIVVGAGVYVLAGNTVSDRTVELARVTRQADSARAEADTLRAYTDFATLRATRTQTVSSLATSRFDWDRALRQVSRVLPKDVWLTSLTGSVSSDATGSGGGSSSSSLRAALPGPAIELTGCTISQSEVSRTMARLRLVDGVQRVSLDHSEKNEAQSSSGAAPAGATASGSGDCREGSSRFPQFDLVVFFDELPTAALAAPTGPTGPSGVATAAATTTAPAAAPVTQTSGAGR